MNKLYKILVLFILTSIPGNIFSQRLSLALESGIGYYRMSDLKVFNSNLIGVLPFDASVTDDFPPFWYFKFPLQYSFRKFVSAGIVYSTLSTGSRVAVSDYSGEFRLDMQLHGEEYGIIAEIFYPVKNLKFAFASEIGLLKTHLNLHEYLRISTETSEIYYSFRADSWYYEPAIKATYRIRFLEAGLHAGYQFDFKREEFSPISHYYDLIIAENRNAKPDWSGFRVGASAAFVLDLSRKDR